jgi:ferredoxin
MKITICACQFYQRLPRKKIAAVQAACCAANVPCEIIPDLCHVSAKDRDKLEDIAADDAVLACQPRAVRSLLEGGGEAKTKCIDLRSASLADILAELALTPMDGPADGPEYDKLSSKWVPWFPVIDAQRCVHCRKCVDFCLFGVYTVEQDKVRVIQPASCKTDCPACARICPQNAIMFPKADEDRLNGSLAEPVKPSAADKISLRERLKHRKKGGGLRLFKEDKP